MAQHTIEVSINEDNDGYEVSLNEIVLHETIYKSAAMDWAYTLQEAINLSGAIVKEAD